MWESIKKFLNKDVVIFKRKFKMYALIMIILFSILTIQTAINVILTFAAGPFLTMCLFIFIFSFDLAFTTYWIYTNTILVGDNT